ncbi:MAG: hypothetical protein Q4D95_06810, partial [Peptoniphilus sp.]|nr:hypothetical protein [Peptoniphilus sp.]
TTVLTSLSKTQSSLRLYLYYNHQARKKQYFYHNRIHGKAKLLFLNGGLITFFAASTACPVPHSFVRPSDRVSGISLISFQMINTT